MWLFPYFSIKFAERTEECPPCSAHRHFSVPEEKVRDMKRFEKLKQNWEFHRTYKRGKAFVSPYYVLYAVQNRKQSIRLGITAGKKIGSAVKRNRAKRVITAAFSNLKPMIKEGYDFVIVARARILSVKSTKLEIAMREHLKCAGLLKE